MSGRPLSVGLGPGSVSSRLVFHPLDVLSEPFVFVSDAFERKQVFNPFEQLQLLDRLGEKVVRPGIDGSLNIA